MRTGGCLRWRWGCWRSAARLAAGRLVAGVAGGGVDATAVSYLSAGIFPVGPGVGLFPARNGRLTTGSSPRWTARPAGWKVASAGTTAE